jgi:hypothetical protein
MFVSNGIYSTFNPRHTFSKKKYVRKKRGPRQRNDFNFEETRLVNSGCATIDGRSAEGMRTTPVQYQRKNANISRPGAVYCNHRVPCTQDWLPLPCLRCVVCNLIMSAGTYSE